MTFTQTGDTFTIHPMAALRPSKHIRNDEELSWEEVMDAKNVMMHFMAKSRVWQDEDEHSMSLMLFYVNLDCHQKKEQKNGKKALLLYQSCMRWEWFNAFKCDEGFNISLIQDNLLHMLMEEVNDAIQDRDNLTQDREVEEVQFYPHYQSQCI